ncbi:helix-turn-helix transcriptional regulator [Halomonas sp. McH1-25]|uniref:AraC family transcriptional regulator n=1 Tax=unclassified Halomonas TaxID=2609666 RepID=UPI001EF6F374|nr:MULTISPECIES: helix-turn-helix domain-containing protein [unclassified Halomonas]MCG7600575.1 helix-turn-helix transcriptional regulator [Halomonas sp. McH1-25]MCP1342042.1 helix-turn-helix transcriptional regulator [Halomonas sp. FL8]MCP1359894.1 helix-turn-helix transcriptional regulator [Halomonas sp. BBD45]MCP1364681.1 helix-turn-helix transcriptional regulator [Halomonas sp. BBD48]
MNPTSHSPSPEAAPRAARRLTVADFTTYEHRYHLTHRFPSLPKRHCLQGGCMVAEGYVGECQPWRHLQLVGSDLNVYQTYETHAREDAPAHVSIIVMLEGCAELTLSDKNCTLTPGRGLLLAYGCPQVLSARHIAGQRVRAVNLTVLEQALEHDPRLASLAPLLQERGGLWSLAVPSGLRQSLTEWLSAQTQGTAALLQAEGLALQLLSQAISAYDGTLTSRSSHPAETPLASSRDHRLLERVRNHLDSHPGDAHSLRTLAEMSCMSPSSLREKFRQRYGQPIFDYLRERRLALAYQLLREGESVQQVATQTGYRHATNFATAFRQRYGVAPSDV